MSRQSTIIIVVVVVAVVVIAIIIIIIFWGVIVIIMNQLNHGLSDVYVHDWISIKFACFDLTIFHFLAKDKSILFNVWPPEPSDYVIRITSREARTLTAMWFKLIHQSIIFL